jgi:hypothetical protein
MTYLPSNLYPIYECFVTSYYSDWLVGLVTHKGCFLLKILMAFNGPGMTIFQEVHGLSTEDTLCTWGVLAKLTMINDDDASFPFLFDVRAMI